MASTQKLSVSIGIAEAKWVRARARRKKKSVSAIVTEALATVQRLEARREFLARLEPDELATDAEAEAIRKQWRA